MSDNNDYHFGVIPSSGQYNDPNEEGYWYEHFVLPQGLSGLLSSAGWTRDYIGTTDQNFGNEGFVQQTFLGASIRDFNLNAGFGDTVSTLSLNLVNDEYNYSDNTPLGTGDDPYHGPEFRGLNYRNYEKTPDRFRPPPVGTPVYFKFGKNPATVEQSYRQTWDDLYKVQTLVPKDKTAGNAWGYKFPRIEDVEKNPKGFGLDLSKATLEPYFYWDEVSETLEDRTELWNLDSDFRGRNHFVFGGILQSYTQNKGPGGQPVYAVNVNDPREILSNVQVLLNNYQGTTYNNKNIINLYGFLEYDPSVEMLQFLQDKAKMAGIVEKTVVTNPTFNVFYRGNLSYWSQIEGWVTEEVPANIQVPEYTWNPQRQSSTLQALISPPRQINLVDQYYFGKRDGSQNAPPEYWPITGQGFSRRSDKGMPWYRISQGLAAIFRQYGEYPIVDGSPIDNEFLNAGFGGQINFRGFNYIVDFGGIPTEKIPLLYYMDFDTIDLLSLAQELCDIISHELYVTLLPVIDHPGCEDVYLYNQEQVELGYPENIIAGVIRLDAIDKTQQPRYGAIKSYLDTLSERGIDIKSSDVGFELSNVVTDKFVAGGQEVDMYYFSTERDRDELQVQEGQIDNLQMIGQNQWDLRYMLQQQALPYYGTIGQEEAVTIPRGFGPYQQIMLDSSQLNAFGVGNQYIATEMEMRAALVSYERWAQFLLSYNDVYIEDISEHGAFLSQLNLVNDQIDDVLNEFKEAVNYESLQSDDTFDTALIDDMLSRIKGKEYAVTVPRCVFRSDRPYMNSDENILASPCSPPFGYPLYYKRATRIGVPQAGVAKVANAKVQVVKDIESLKAGMEDSNNPFLDLATKDVLRKRIAVLEEDLRIYVAVKNITNETYKDDPEYQEYIRVIEEAKVAYKNYDKLKDNLADNKNRLAFLQTLVGGKDGDGGLLDRFLYNIDKTAQRHEENAKKVYEFIRKIAEENLGKKFLVRIPKAANLNFSNRVEIWDGALYKGNVFSGPFGFKPRAINYDPNYETSQEFYTKLNIMKQFTNISPYSVTHHYLADYVDPSDPTETSRLTIGQKYDGGALKGNYNPFSEKWEWNYKPEPQGGYFTFDQYGRNVTAIDLKDIKKNWFTLPLSIQQGLCPVDPTNLTSESSRIQCYVKYENSQFLSFDGVNADDMTQQVLDYGGQFTPDVTEQLPNNNESKPDLSFSTKEDYEKKLRLKEVQPPSMAFVKCDLDEKLYLPPRLEKRSTEIWARDYEMSLTIPEHKTRTIISADGCEKTIVNDYPEPNPIFSVPPDGGRDGEAADWWCFKREYDKVLEADIVVSKKTELDDEHVYALVTVPGRVKSTADLRWQDGPFQLFKSVEKKHLMMQDVVFIDEFNKPNLSEKSSGLLLACGPPPVFETREEAEQAASGYGLFGSSPNQPEALAARAAEAALRDEPVVIPSSGFIPGKPENWIDLTLGQITEARKQTTILERGFKAEQPEIDLAYTQPSPIMPNMFAIPLMSMERCYGPWLSASQLDQGADPRVKFSDIGGRVEFVKNEELTPWNYAGYQLLNEAGSLQANFSNSLLLFSERGGFVMPDAPTGIALATALQQEGPLITSIGISVGTNSVETTVKLDLYTSKFGKLAKQKEEAISKMARERQKLVDQQNAASRRGLGKRNTSSDLVNTVMQAGGNLLMRQVDANTSLREANKELSAEIDEQVLVVGKNGGTSLTTKDFKRKMETENREGTNKSLNNLAVVPQGGTQAAYSQQPNSELPMMPMPNQPQMDMRTDDSLNRRQ